MSSTHTSPAAAARGATCPGPAAAESLRAARQRAEAGDLGQSVASINELLQRWPDHGPLFVCVAGALREGRADEAPGAHADLLQSPDALPRLYAPAAAPVSGRARLPLVGTALGLRAALSVANVNGAASATAHGPDWAPVVDRLLALFAATPAAELPRVAPRIAIQLAIQLDERGMSAEAHDIATFAQRRWPTSMALRTVAARFLVQERRWDALDATLKPVLERGGTNRMARGYEALAALADGRLARCADWFDRYGMPHDSAYLAELAILLARYDARFGDRHDELPGRLELPEDAAAARLLGRAEKLLLAERFEEGLAALQDDRVAPRLPTKERPTPTQGLWLRLRGFACFKLKRFDDAALSFAAAVAADPLDPWYVSGAGQAFLFRGDAESAVACLRRVLPVGPDDFLSFFHLGLAYARLGRIADARRALRTGFREFFVDTLEVSLQPMIREILGGAADRAYSETVRM